MPSKSRCQTKTKNIVFFPHRGTRRNMKTRRCTRKPRLASAKNRFSALARALAARKCGKHYAGTRMRIDSAGSRATAASHRFSHVRLRSVFHRSVAVSHVWNIFHRTRRNVRDLPCGFCTRHTRKPKTARIANGFCTPHLWPHFLRPHQHRKKGAFN